MSQNYFFVYNTADGTLNGTPYKTSSTAWTNIPDGCAVIGPISETDTTAQSAAQSPTEYTVQNGQIVHSNPPTTQERLDQAKAAKRAELYAEWTNACSTFQSSATGTLYTYTNDDKAIGRYNAIMNRILKDSTYVPPTIYTHEAGYVAHTAAQFTQVFDDGMADEQKKAQNYEQKCVDLDNIQESAYPTPQDAIDAVHAVTY